MGVIILRYDLSVALRLYYNLDANIVSAFAKAPAIRIGSATNEAGSLKVAALLAAQYFPATLQTNCDVTSEAARLSHFKQRVRCGDNCRLNLSLAFRRHATDACCSVRLTSR